MDLQGEAVSVATVDRGATGAGTDTDPPLPLTEWLLARLSGPRWAWLAVWAAVPVVATSLVFPLVTRGRANALPSDPLRGLVFSYALLISAWAVRRLHARVRELRGDVKRLLDGAGTDPFQGLTDPRKPVVSAAILALLSSVTVAYLYGPVAAVLVAPFPFVLNLAYLTAFWVYVSVLTGLHRLGSHQLSLHPFPEDPSLGLRPVGQLALTAFRAYLAVFLPLLVVTSNWLLLVVCLALFCFGVVLFFSALWRIHRQMRQAGDDYRDWARGLYAAACAPIKVDGATALRDQAPMLSAAEALERRADRIQRWPFDEGTMVRILTIATSVAAMTVARFLLAPLGL